MKTITLNEQEWALVKEAISHLRESACEDMMYFQNAANNWDGKAPTTLADYAIIASSDAADKVCLLDQLHVKLITKKGDLTNNFLSL